MKGMMRERHERVMENYGKKYGKQKRVPVREGRDGTMDGMEFQALRARI